MVIPWRRSSGSPSSQKPSWNYPPDFYLPWYPCIANSAGTNFWSNSETQVHTRSLRLSHLYRSGRGRLPILYNRRRVSSFLSLKVKPLCLGCNRILCTWARWGLSRAKDRCRSGRCRGFASLGSACLEALRSLCRSSRSRARSRVFRDRPSSFAWSIYRLQGSFCSPIFVALKVYYRRQIHKPFENLEALPRSQGHSYQFFCSSSPYSTLSYCSKDHL